MSCLHWSLILFFLGSVADGLKCNDVAHRKDIKCCIPKCNSIYDIAECDYRCPKYYFIDESKTNKRCSANGNIIAKKDQREISLEAICIYCDSLCNITDGMRHYMNETADPKSVIIAVCFSVSSFIVSSTIAFVYLCHKARKKRRKTLRELDNCKEQFNYQQLKRSNNVDDKHQSDKNPPSKNRKTSCRLGQHMILSASRLASESNYASNGVSMGTSGKIGNIRSRTGSRNDSCMSNGTNNLEGEKIKTNQSHPKNNNNDDTTIVRTSNHTNVSKSENSNEGNEIAKAKNDTQVSNAVNDSVEIAKTCSDTNWAGTSSYDSTTGETFRKETLVCCNSTEQTYSLESEITTSSEIRIVSERCVNDSLSYNYTYTLPNTCRKCEIVEARKVISFQPEHISLAKAERVIVVGNPQINIGHVNNFSAS